jgi:hypothetical protein
MILELLGRRSGLPKVLGSSQHITIVVGGLNLGGSIEMISQCGADRRACDRQAGSNTTSAGQLQLLAGQEHGRTIRLPDMLGLTLAVSHALDNHCRRICDGNE